MGLGLRKKSSDKLLFVGEDLGIWPKTLHIVANTAMSVWDN